MDGIVLFQYKDCWNQNYSGQSFLRMSKMCHDVQKSHDKQHGIVQLWEMPAFAGKT